MIPLALTLAIILPDTGDPLAHTTPPSFGGGWPCVGQWGRFTAVAIGPHTFLAAAHVGGTIGQPFLFRGQSYPTLSVQQVPDGSDLNLWRVAGTLPAWAPLYPGSAVGKPCTLIGRGTQRGVAVFTYSNNPLSPRERYPAITELAGWQWGPWDGRQRWGTNVLGGDATRYQVSFSPTGCTASIGDSSAACFALDPGDNQWKLAGLVSTVWVVGPWAGDPSSPPREGAYLSTRWLYQGGDQLNLSSSSQTFITPLCGEGWWLADQASR